MDAGRVLSPGDAVPHAVQGGGAYTLPYGVRISGTFQSVPGPVIAANQIYTGVLPSLGRPFFAGQSTVNVVEPGTTYGDRLNQVDLRFSKMLNLGRGGSI